jgi:glycine oxidase
LAQANPKEADRSTRLKGLRVVVAGAGAIGSVLGLRLVEAGARVVLADPAPLGANASGVAAGMLAPAFETVLDPPSAGHFDLLSAARDLWPALAERVGAGLDRSGALWTGDGASNADVLARLKAAGAKAEAMDAVAAERLSPGLRAPAGAVFTADDWSLDPIAMLTALQTAFEASGGEVRRAPVTSANGAAADALILAAGLAPEGLAPPPELELLQPIKGQILRLDGGAPRSGPVARGEGIYVVPRDGGPLVGATMEPGVRDLVVEPAAIQALKGLAVRLFPALAAATAAGQAGVRASTPDGLPLVGQSRTTGTWLAMGARRNGWLLAPLIAEVLVDQLTGGDGGRWARLFEPSRF